MKVCTCFLLIRIFAFTNSIPRTKPQPPPETVPENNDDVYSEENKNLDYDHTLKATVTDGDKNLKLIFKAPKVESLTDFIQETVDILNICEDTAFKDFFLILDKEIRNYHYKGCKFSELTENRDTRSLLQQTLKTIRGKSVTYTKASINEVADMLRDETYDKSVKELLDYINSLYKNSKGNFHRFLSNLNHYRQTKSMTHGDLVQVVRHGVRTILFNHYTKLDTYTKRELNKIIKIFWEKIKNSSVLNAEIHEIDTNPSAKKSFDVSKNVMNEVKELDLHFKDDLKTNLKTERETFFSKETHYEQSQDKEIEEHVTSNESQEHATDYTAEGFSSRQSFDSSSNSIKLSQERQVEYNTQRYMTLYTEEISYKASTMKETEISAISKKLMTRRHKLQKQLTTTPRYNPRDVTPDRTKKIEMLRTNMDGKQRDISPNLRHDTEGVLIQELKHKLREKPHYNQPRDYSKPDKTISKSRHKNAQIYSQYDAVIDVQLAKTDLLESLRIFAPVEIGSRESEKYDTSLYTKATIRRRAQTTINHQNATAPAKSPVRYSISYESHYRKPVNKSRGRIPPLPPNNRPVEQYVKDTKPKKKYPTRRSDSDTQVFNNYIINRINALEKELKDLKQIHDVRSKIHKNNTDEVQLSNVTDQRKDMNRNDIQRLSNTNHNSVKKDVIKENNNEYNTKSNATNSESITNKNASSKPSTMNNETANVTIIGNTTISQVTNTNIIITKTDNEELNQEETTKTVTFTNSTVEVTTATSMAVADDDSPSTAVVVRSTKAYVPPAYYEYNDREIDPFDHMNDGLDLNM